MRNAACLRQYQCKSMSGAAEQALGARIRICPVNVGAMQLTLTGVAIFSLLTP
jgi:hypothetical protein